MFAPVEVWANQALKGMPVSKVGDGELILRGASASTKSVKLSTIDKSVMVRECGTKKPISAYSVAPSSRAPHADQGSKWQMEEALAKVWREEMW